MTGNRAKGRFLSEAVPVFSGDYYVAKVIDFQMETFTFYVIFYFYVRPSSEISFFFLIFAPKKGAKP